VDWGGGLAWCDGLVHNNVISGNSANEGAGLCGCDGTVSDNLINGNRAFGEWPSGGGGGLNFCWGTITNNEITENSAYWGGGLFFCGGTISNNAIIDNSATLVGGGLKNCYGTIESNTISRNTGEQLRGGGLDDCGATTTNCIIWGNRAPSGSQIWSSRTPTHSCIQDWTGGGEGNISENPQFVKGGYQLKADSPCIDAGRNDDWMWDAVDPDGSPRISNARVDMGAYEYSDGVDRSPPYVWDRDPAPDALQVPVGANIALHLKDQVTGVDETSIIMTVNGLEVIPTTTGTPMDYTLSYDPPSDFPYSERVSVTVDAADLSSPANVMEQVTYSFTTIREPSPVATWYVDGSVPVSGDGTSPETAFMRIQEGIDAAFDGDTVIVAEGTYLENIQFRGRNITLTSRDSLDPAVVANTIIDGGQSGPVLTFSGSENETCLISGFTIRNGKAKNGGGICGGTRVRRTHATVENNIMTTNVADSGGGLAYCDGAIQYNVIRKNIAEDFYGGGGGLYECGGEIANNVVAQNSSGDYGGGLARCNGIIRNNTIAANSTRHDGGGIVYSSAAIQNNVIIGNRNNWFGGGLAYCDGPIQNCTISGNQVNDKGGGLWACPGSIQSCIIWANEAPTHSQISDSREPTYCCIQGWAGGEGNTPDDPLFIDPDGPDNNASTYEDNDYRLAAGSRSIDAGVNEDWMWDALDLDGNPRIWRGKDSWTVDMGAYECSFETWYVNGAVPASGDGGSWERAFQTIQEGIDAAAAGDEVIVAQRMYAENIHFEGKNIVLRSTDPSDPSVVASTIIIDAGEKTSVVTFDGSETSECLLLGFTIRNGMADYGGGLYWCHGTVEGNAISDNSAARGGGLDSCNGTIERNTIAGNSVSYGGGGLAWCEGTIQYNLIISNSAFYGGGLAWGEGTIQNNLIVGNCGDDRGGGLEGCDGVVRNNTIVDNAAPDRGGGLAACDAAILNCIIWGNTAAYSAQLSACTAPTYSCIQEWDEGEGNFSGDPGFIDADGADDDPHTYQDNDYHLMEGSPCIDTGKNEEWMETAVDLDGNRRILFGAFSLTVDIGAHEYGFSALPILLFWKPHGGLELIWQSYPGYTYIIWSCLDLLTGEWIEEATLPSIGLIPWWTDLDTDYRCKFYKIQIE